MRLNIKLKNIVCILSIAAIAGKVAANISPQSKRVTTSSSVVKAPAQDTANITLKISVPPICEIHPGIQTAADQDFPFTVNSNAPGNTVLSLENGGVGVLTSLAGQKGEFTAQLKKNTNDSPADTIIYTGVGQKTGFITTKINTAKSAGLHYGEAEGKITLVLHCEK